MKSCRELDSNKLRETKIMTIEKTSDLLYNKRCNTSMRIVAASPSITKLPLPTTITIKPEGKCMLKNLAILYTLETLTHLYWCVSRTRTGRSKERTTVAKAIETINLIEQNLGPARPLLKYVRVLSDAIVEGKAKKTKIPASVSVLVFKRKLLVEVPAVIAVGGI